MGVTQVVLCAIVCLQLEFTVSQTPSSSVAASYGTQTAEDWVKNMATAEENMKNGVMAVVEPMMKMAVDTAPNAAHLYAFLNGVNVDPAIAAKAKDVFGRVALAGGKTLGNAAVMGSSMAGDAMKVASDVLQAKGKIFEAGLKAGLNLAGKMADHAINGHTIAANIASGGLTNFGDGMQSAAIGVNGLSESIAKMVTAVGDKLTTALTWAHQMMATLKSKALQLADGTFKFENTEHQKLYDALMSYVKILRNIQSQVGQLTGTVSISTTTNSGTTTSS